MRKRGLSLFLAGFVVATVLPAVPAQATCRPTISTPVPPAPVSTSPETTIPGDTVPTETPTTAAPALPPAPRYCWYSYRMQWPVLGGGAIGSTFGADRDGGTRLHAGNDIMAPKMTPVVAVRDGVISSVHDSRGDCCWLILTHDDGWSSWYLHLNNDTSGTDDGHGVGIRPGLVAGTRVVAGEVISWVGDSGNAEPGPPHLHFELHRPGIGAIDPYPSLRKAYRQVPALDDVVDGFAGSFTDDDGMRAEPVFHYLVTAGAIASCDVWGAAVCPAIAATNLDAATWIGAVGRVLVPTDAPTDPAFLIEASIANQLVCGAAECPPPPLTRGEVATMLLWALRQAAHEDAISASPESTEAPPPPYWETDPAWALSHLRTLGLVDDCPILDLPLDSLLSRSELAVQVGQTFRILPAMTCGGIA